MSSALVLRIKFPVTYPIIHKVVRIDSDKLWLEDDRKLSEYPQLTADGLEYIEFKSRNDKGKSGGGGGGGCCTLL